jgi:hypothetical protein
VNDPSIWNVLHDGTITAIDGVVPGTLKVSVDIWYLRPFFAPAGTAFVVELTECDLFEVLRWDDATPPADPVSFAALQPSILEASVEHDEVKMIWIGGELRLRYASVRISLDTGSAIPMEALLAAAERYWDSFGRRSPPVE